MAAYGSLGQLMHSSSQDTQYLTGAMQTTLRIGYTSLSLGRLMARSILFNRQIDEWIHTKVCQNSAVSVAHKIL